MMLLDMLTTEQLETDLRETSVQLDLGKMRFNDLCRELALRRKENKETGLDQPELKTSAQRQASALELANDAINILTRKIIAMEAEQAKLVVEVEAAKWMKREAEERLSLVAKFVPDNHPNGFLTTITRRAFDEGMRVHEILGPENRIGDIQAAFDKWHEINITNRPR